LKETISNLPQSEIICPGQLLAPVDVICQGPLVIEACEKFQKSGKALLARSLIEPGENVTVRLMNLTTNPQIVYKNTVVGTTSAVAHVVENQKELDNPDFGVGNIGVFPEHLKELYAEAIKDFNPDEVEKTKENSPSFSGFIF
jgi:hypothetical protein